MPNSDEQFTDLLANIVARLKRALLQTNEPPPIGALLLSSGEVRGFTGAAKEEGTLREAVNALQNGMIEHIHDPKALAGAIAYPDYSQSAVIVYVENTELFCAKYTIPVSSDLNLELDKLEVADGEIFLFGE